jgi:hypothetical protein
MTTVVSHQSSVISRRSSVRSRSRQSQVGVVRPQSESSGRSRSRQATVGVVRPQSESSGRQLKSSVSDDAYDPLLRGDGSSQSASWRFPRIGPIRLRVLNPSHAGDEAPREAGSAPHGWILSRDTGIARSGDLSTSRIPPRSPIRRARMRNQSVPANGRRGAKTAARGSQKFQRTQRPPFEKRAILQGISLVLA